MSWYLWKCWQVNTWLHCCVFLRLKLKTLPCFQWKPWLYGVAPTKSYYRAFRHISMTTTATCAQQIQVKAEAWGEERLLEDYLRGLPLTQMLITPVTARWKVKTAATKGRWALKWSEKAGKKLLRQVFLIKKQVCVWEGFFQFLIIVKVWANTIKAAFML